MENNRVNKQKQIVISLIECFNDIINSSDIDASYHLTDISNNIEDLISNEILTEKQAKELEARTISLFNFVKKVK